MLPSEGSLLDGNCCGRWIQRLRYIRGCLRGLHTCPGGPERVWRPWTIEPHAHILSSSPTQEPVRSALEVQVFDDVADDGPETTNESTGMMVRPESERPRSLSLQTSSALPPKVLWVGYVAGCSLP